MNPQEPPTGAGPLPESYQPSVILPSQQGGVVPSARPPAGPVGGTQSVAPIVPKEPVLGQDDDVDSLDKRWISKAKHTVDQTKSDPFIESRELSKIKADFLKARYNKDVKVTEERSQ